MKPKPFVALNHLTVPVVIGAVLLDQVGVSGLMSPVRYRCGRLPRRATRRDVESSVRHRCEPEYPDKMLKSRQSPPALRRLFRRLAPGVFRSTTDEELSQPCADGMRDLCSGLVVGFPKAGKSRRVRVCDRERQFLLA